MPIGPQSVSAPPDDLVSRSFLTPNITYAGKENIFALNGGGAGSAGVIELNGLQDYIEIISSDSSITVAPVGQDINLSVNFPPFPSTVTSLNALTNAVQIISSDNSLTVTGTGNDIDLQVNPVAVVESLNTLDGIVNITSPSSTIGITVNATTNEIELESLGTAGVTELNTLSGSISLTSPNSSIAIAKNAITNEIELETVSGGPANILSGTDIFITADEGSSSVSTADVNILAKNGGGGNVSVISQAGGLSQSGGIINLEAQGGSGVGGLFGRVSLVAQPGTDILTGIKTGGLVEITANTGLSTGALCSVIRQSAASIQSFAGAISAPYTANPGFNTIYGNQGISITAGLPAVLPQVPFTLYQYASGGISLDSTVYTNQMRPYWDGLGAVPNLVISGRSLPSSAYVELEDVQSISMTSGAITGVSTINGASYPPPSGGSAVGPTGSVQYSNGSGGFLGNTGLLYNGTSRITNATGTNFIDINETGNADSIAIQSPSQVNITGGPLISLNAGQALFLDAGTLMKVTIAGSPGTVGQVLTSDGTYTTWQPPSVLGFVDLYQIYVAPNGSDTFGTGSQQTPYATIGRAITRRATITNTRECSIIVSSGIYTENITLTQNTFLCGITTGEQNQPCNIIGNVVLSTSSGQVGLSGLQVTAPATGIAVNIAGFGGTYSLNNCNITGVGNQTLSISGGTTFITECRIIGATGLFTPISVSVNATATFRNTNITSSNSESIIVCSGDLTMRDCNIQNTGISTTFKPLISFLGSTSKGVNLALCSLTYDSTATDTTGQKCCIQFGNTAGTYTASITNCVLICEGATTGSGGQIQCIQDPGAGGVSLKYGNLLAGATANHIAPTITKVAYIPVP